MQVQLSLSDEMIDPTIAQYLIALRALSPESKNAVINELKHMAVEWKQGDVLSVEDGNTLSLLVALFEELQ